MEFESKGNYIARMKETCWGFRHYKDIEPIWTPGEGDIAGFIHDEVIRQGHDTRIMDGKNRIEWMHNAWDYASKRFRDGYTVPWADDLLVLGRLVEIHENDGGIRKANENVWIGDRRAPEGGGLVSAMILALFDMADMVKPVLGLSNKNPNYTENNFDEKVREVETVDDWYLAYEWVHPWRDGNGRTGKILHNWLLGTLDNPVLVADYFGGGNP
jgi:hypothetical protein